MEFRNADTKRDYSVHPSPPLVRRAESMTNETKARNTSLRLDQRSLGFKLRQEHRGHHFYLFPHLCGVNNNEMIYVMYRKAD